MVKVVGKQGTEKVFEVRWCSEDWGLGCLGLSIPQTFTELLPELVEP